MTHLEPRPEEPGRPAHQYRIEYRDGRNIIITPHGARYEVVRPIEEMTDNRWSGEIVWRFTALPADTEVHGFTLGEVIDVAAGRGYLRQLPD